jgi:hypothetical protein
LAQADTTRRAPMSWSPKYERRLTTSTVRPARVHHLPAAEVDADVPQSEEEEQVPGFQPGARHAAPAVIERV